MESRLDAERITRYLLSLPERTLRSGSALAGGLLREIGDVTLPAAVRRTRLYRVLVEASLRFMIEDLGDMEGAYPGEEKLVENFLVRRTAAHGLEWVGLMTFHASPVWVMAALADITGGGRQLIREIAGSLQKEGLLDSESQFESVEQILDGLEAAAGRLATVFNTPPLNVKGLREEWSAIQKHLRETPPRNLPNLGTVANAWEKLKQASAAEQRPVFELSSMMALSAIAKLPRNVWWLSHCAAHAAKATGEYFGSGLLDHYTNALVEIHETGYLRYWAIQLRPYLRAAAMNFSPDKVSTTERLLSPAPTEN